MYQVDIQEAMTQLSTLIHEALDGEEVIIARDDRPLVRLEALPSARAARRLGAAAGLVVRMEEDFDDPAADFAGYS